MSDHLDAPGPKSPNMDAREDSTDISAFQNPADPTRSFLAMSLFTGVRGIDFLRTSPLLSSRKFNFQFQDFSVVSDRTVPTPCQETAGSGR